MNATYPTAGLLIGTAVTFFICGVYFEQGNIIQRMQDLIQSDPYAYYIRNKIYDVFRYFRDDPEYIENQTLSRMQEIMKYGFPGLDDIRLYNDFVLSYDRRNRVAHWVCEHLTPERLRHSINVSRRRTSYQIDMSVPSNFRADPSDYYRSGFDRGHLAAAGNHHGHQTDCNETFYLTNIAPQVGKGFNRNAWNDLEIYVRNLTGKYGSVYVCTGPLYKPKTLADGKSSVEYEIIGLNMVAVPTHFFKVIIVESKLPRGRPYMEAYVLPNASLPDKVNLRSFLCDIREIEHYAGLTFYDGIRRSYFLGTNYSRESQLFRKMSQENSNQHRTA